MEGMDAIVLAVRHSVFMDLDPDEVFKAVGKPCAIIDCFTILDDKQIERYFELGCEVKGMGRGHINRIKRKVRESKRYIDEDLHISEKIPMPARGPNA